VLGHGVFPFHGVGDVEHHHHAMAAAALNAFAEPSAHYLAECLAQLKP
jgi:hypothetical protein